VHQILKLVSGTVIYNRAGLSNRQYRM